MEQVEKEEILATVKAFADKTEERFDEILTVLKDHSKRLDNHSSRTDDTLSAVNDFANKVEERFNGVDKRFDGVDKRLDGVDKRLESLEQRVGHVENQMVTKDYLDNKLADLRGGWVVAVRREDEKVDTLVNKLREEDSLSVASAQAVLEMKPLVRA